MGAARNDRWRHRSPSPTSPVLPPRRREGSRSSTLIRREPGLFSSARRPAVSRLRAPSFPGKAQTKKPGPRLSAGRAEKSCVSRVENIPPSVGVWGGTDGPRVARSARPRTGSAVRAGLCGVITNVRGGGESAPPWTLRAVPPHKGEGGGYFRALSSIRRSKFCRRFRSPTTEARGRKARATRNASALTRGRRAEGLGQGP